MVAATDPMVFYLAVLQGSAAVVTMQFQEAYISTLVPEQDQVLAHDPNPER
jgi:hypothetical protein